MLHCELRPVVTCAMFGPLLWFHDMSLGQPPFVSGCGPLVEAVLQAQSGCHLC